MLDVYVHSVNNTAFCLHDAICGIVVLRMHQQRQLQSSVDDSKQSLQIASDPVVIYGWNVSESDRAGEHLAVESSILAMVISSLRAPPLC